MKKTNNIKKQIPKALLFLSMAIVSASCGTNQKPEDSKDVAEEHNNAKFDNNDNERNAQFLVNVAEINMQEIQLAQLAQQSAIMTDVKELAKMVEDTHRKSQGELVELAKQKLITLPSAPTDNAQDAYKKLSDKSNNDFDKAFCDMMVSGHKDAIALFEKAETESTDTDIKAWATATLPGLRTHLDYALTCQKNCK